MILRLKKEQGLKYLRRFTRCLFVYNSLAKLKKAGGQGKSNLQVNGLASTINAYCNIATLK